MWFTGLFISFQYNIEAVYFCKELKSELSKTATQVHLISRAGKLEHVDSWPTGERTSFQAQNSLTDPRDSLFSKKSRQDTNIYGSKLLWNIYSGHQARCISGRNLSFQGCVQCQRAARYNLTQTTRTLRNRKAQVGYRRSSQWNISAKQAIHLRSMGRCCRLSTFQWDRRWHFWHLRMRRVRQHGPGT